jgi:uncharacterized protein YndB with AHSA1/START domain
MKGTESIVVDYPLNEPPEQIWRTLTEPHLLAQWLMENDIQPTVGHKFTFRAQPQGDWDGIVYCEVLEVDPPRKLAYSWQGGNEKDSPGAPRLDTTVTWTLTPTAAGGTLLHLLHHGFRPDDYAYQVIGQGWRSMLTAEKITHILSAAQAPVAP